jgi:pheromone a factor receptor
MESFQVQSQHPLPTMTVILPILSFFAIILEIAPFFWHLRNRNFGACWLIGWLFICQLFYFVNPMVWPRDDINNWWDGSGLCDIEARLFLASTIGIPGSTTCIIRRLARIMDTNKGVVVPSAAQRSLDTALDVLLCTGLPVLLMVVYYVVQPIRYFIYTTTGCDWALQRSWPSILLVSIWPLILAVINAGLAGKYFLKLKVAQLTKL